MTSKELTARVAVGIITMVAGTIIIKQLKANGVI